MYIILAVCHRQFNCYINTFVVSLQEIKCLQKKYKKLEPECKSAVRNFTKITISDPTLDFLLMKACEPMIQMFCTVSRLSIGQGC
jgi:hypothetical protein